MHKNHEDEKSWQPICVSDLTPLREIGEKSEVTVVYCALNKLLKLCKQTCPVNKKEGCNIRHRNPIAVCTKHVVCDIPLLCGVAYVGQTVRCLNVRLLEHRRNTEKRRGGFLAQHSSECGCTPIFAHTTVIA